MEKEDNSFGTASVILGIFSILSAPGIFFIYIYGPFVGLVLGIIGLVFGIIQFRRSKNSWAKAGLVLNIIGIIACVIIIIWFICLLNRIIPEIQNQMQALQNVQSTVGSLGSQAAIGA